MRQRLHLSPDAVPGAHRFTRAEIAALRAVADRVGTPLNAAAVAFLESAQDELGMGPDGRLWLVGNAGAIHYPPERILEALRRAWRQWQRWGGTRDGCSWMSERHRWGPDGRPVG